MNTYSGCWGCGKKGEDPRPLKFISSMKLDVAMRTPVLKDLLISPRQPKSSQRFILVCVVMLRLLPPQMKYVVLEIMEYKKGFSRGTFFFVTLATKPPDGLTGESQDVNKFIHTYGCISIGLSCWLRW